MPVESIQHLKETLGDRERELSELQARQAETRGVRPLPKVTVLVAGIALILLGAICSLGPVGYVVLSPPDAREEFLAICGLSQVQSPSGSSVTDGAGLTNQVIGAFAIFLPAVVVIVGSGILLIVKASHDRRSAARANDETARRMSEIDARIAQIQGEAETIRRRLAAGDSLESSKPSAAK